MFPRLRVALLWEEVFKGWIWLEEVSNWAEARGAFERSNLDTLLPVGLPETQANSLPSFYSRELHFPSCLLRHDGPWARGILSSPTLFLVKHVVK